MRVLLTNNHLANVGGSETWTYTMAREMMRRGYDVDVLTLISGYFAEAVKNDIRINPPLKSEYHLILVNHNSCYFKLSDAKIKGFKIFTSHGTVPSLEKPVAGADKYVAISEEVQRHVESLDFSCSLILNPVDCDRFKPIRPLNEKLQRVLIITDAESAAQNARLVCDELGLEFQHIGKSNATLMVEKSIDWADLVITLGRGCYEAMAGGRNVIVYDSRSYMGHLADGMVTPETISKFIKTNCSGRCNKFIWGNDDLKKALLSYDPSLGIKNREYALENFDVRKIADQYLQLAGLQ